MADHNPPSAGGEPPIEMNGRERDPLPTKLPPINRMSSGEGAADEGMTTFGNGNKVASDSNDSGGHVTTVAIKKIPERDPNASKHSSGDPIIEMDTSDSPHGDEVEVKEPIGFCKFICNRTNLAFGITLGGHIFFILTTVICMLAGYDIFPMDFQTVPLSLTEDDVYLRTTAWKYRNEDPSVIAANTSASFIGERTEMGDLIQVFFKAGNVLTKERLQAIQNLETEIFNVNGWSDNCQLEAGVCKKPISLIRFFDGSYSAAGLNDPNFNDIPGTLYKASQIPALNNLLEGLVGKSAQITSTEATTGLTRILLYLGVPFPGYDLTTDSKEDQKEDILQPFQVDHVKGILDPLFDNGLEGMSVVFFSGELVSWAISEQVTSDLMLALGSMLFIYFFMVFQTGSLFITSFAIGSILFSFLGCNLIYRIVLDFQYFGMFHVLSIFIILGIGADNIFVFYDAWRATAQEAHPTLAHRLSTCYRRAPSSMAITSLTTFVAFLSNYTSPLLAISTFGLFSAILILVNFCSAIIFFPCVVIVYHKHFEEWQWPCLKPIGEFFKKIKCCKGSAKEEDENKGDDGENPNMVVRFFKGPYWEAVVHKYYRWIFIGVCGTMIVIGIYFATTLEISEKETQILKKGTNYQDALDLNSEGFKTALDDRNVKVYISWGLKNQDLGDCHKTDFKCKGKTVWADDLDMNPSPAQVMLLELCGKIRNLTGHEELFLLRDPTTGKVEVECFMDKMEEYLVAHSSGGSYTADLSMPYTSFKLQNWYTYYTATDIVYNATLVQTNVFYRVFESLMEFWLNNGYDGTTSPDYKDYSVMVGTTDDQFKTANILKTGYTDLKYGTRLRYCGIIVTLSIIHATQAYTEGLDIYYAWEKFVQDEVALLPASLQSGVQFTGGGSSSNTWHLFKMQEKLAASASSGMIMGLGLAFVVLTIATMNIVISTMATLVLIFVTATVTGFIPMMGWKFSVIESVNLSLVVGLSVDYVVHLSESYHSSKHHDRKLKVRDMLENMGVSVVSGACTTMGSSIFLMFAIIQFFYQFGLFIFATIGFSMVYSLALYSALLGMLGPNGHFGSLVPAVTWVKHKVIGRKNTDVDCDACHAKGYHDKDLYQSELLTRKMD